MKTKATQLSCCLLGQRIAFQGSVRCFMLMLAIAGAVFSIFTPFEKDIAKALIRTNCDRYVCTGSYPDYNDKVCGLLLKDGACEIDWTACTTCTGATQCSGNSITTGACQPKATGGCISSWVPDISTYYKGIYSSQTDGCGNSRMVEGTKNCSTSDDCGYPYTCGTDGVCRKTDIDISCKTSDTHACWPVNTKFICDGSKGNVCKISENNTGGDCTTQSAGAVVTDSTKAKFNVPCASCDPYTRLGKSCSYAGCYTPGSLQCDANEQNCQWVTSGSAWKCFMGTCDARAGQSCKDGNVCTTGEVYACDGITCSGGTAVTPVCPDPSTIACGQPIVSTNGCGSCSGTGTKDCGTSLPSISASPSKGTSYVPTGISTRLTPSSTVTSAKYAVDSIASQSVGIPFTSVTQVNLPGTVSGTHYITWWAKDVAGKESTGVFTPYEIKTPAAGAVVSISANPDVIDFGIVEKNKNYTQNGSLSVSTTGNYKVTTPTCLLYNSTNTCQLTLTPNPITGSTSSTQNMTYALNIQGDIGQTNSVSVPISAEESKSCTATTWTPSLTTVCSGQTFTQTSNCGTTKSVTGTKDCSASCTGAAAAAAAASGTSTCTPACTTDTAWTPDVSTVCSGQTFTQTSNCGKTKSVTGTKGCTTTNVTVNFVLDSVAPSVTSIVGPNPTGPVNNASTVTYTVTFSEPVTDFTASDIQLNKTGTANAQVSVNGTDTTYTVTLSTLTGDGNLGITIPAGTVKDQVGNANTASSPSSTVVVDNTSPTVTSIVGPNPTGPVNNAATVTYTVTFSEPVTGFTADDIQLNKTGTANAQVSVSGSGTTYTVTLSTLTGNGTLGISILGGAVTDMAGNQNGLSSASTFITIDTTAPVATNNLAPSGEYYSEIQVTNNSFNDSSGVSSVKIYYGNDYNTALTKETLPSVACSESVQKNCYVLFDETNGTLSFSLSIHTSNTYAFVVTDKLGNVSEPLFRRYKITALRPIISNVQIATTEEQDMLVITGMNFGKNGSVLFYNQSRQLMTGNTIPYEIGNDGKNEIQILKTALTLSEQIRYVKIENGSADNLSASDLYAFSFATIGTGEQVPLTLTPTSITVFPGNTVLFSAYKTENDVYTWSGCENITSTSSYSNTNKLFMTIKDSKYITKNEQCQLKVQTGNDVATAMIYVVAANGTASGSTSFNMIYDLPGVAIIQKEGLTDFNGSWDIYANDEEPMGVVNVEADYGDSFNGSVTLTGDNNQSVVFQKNDFGTPKMFTGVTVKPTIIGEGLQQVRIYVLPTPPATLVDKLTDFLQTLRMPVPADLSPKVGESPYIYRTTGTCYQLGTVLTDKESGKPKSYIVGDCPTTKTDHGPIGIADGYIPTSEADCLMTLKAYLLYDTCEQME